MSLSRYLRKKSPLHRGGRGQVRPDAEPLRQLQAEPIQERRLGRIRAHHTPQAEVAATLRRDFLVTEERADKLSGAWGRHPLLGRMYLPAYRAGTERVAELRRTYPADRILPAIYGCSGLVDIVTIDEILK